MDFFGIEVEQPQTVRVEVRGGDVAWLPDSTTPEGHAVELDLVERWGRAVLVGLLGSASSVVTSRANVRKLVTDTKLRHHVWEIELEAVDWGALRVLRNLLLAREFEE